MDILKGTRTPKRREVIIADFDNIQTADQTIRGSRNARSTTETSRYTQACFTKMNKYRADYAGDSLVIDMYLDRYKFSIVINSSLAILGLLI